MSRSTLSRNFSTPKAQLGLLLLLLCGIAVLMGLSQRPQSEVTISGLNLESDRDSIFRRLGSPSFQTGSPRPTHAEYWYSLDGGTTLRLDFDQTGKLLQVQGGKPEIDGEDVSDWSLEKIESALGRAAGARRGHSFRPQDRKPEDRLLRYPERHLLVRQNADSSIEFLLFTGTR